MFKKQLGDSYDLEAMTFMLTTYKQAIEEGLGNDNTWIVVKEV